MANQDVISARPLLNERDYLLLFRLSSMYQALSLSAVDPCVIGGMFYDCYNPEDDAVQGHGHAERIMKARIEEAAEDIRRHNYFHQQFLADFKMMEHSLESWDRRSISQTLEHSLIPKFMEYGKLVLKHQKRRIADYFLYYPHCLDGHVY